MGAKDLGRRGEDLEIDAASDVATRGVPRPGRVQAVVLVSKSVGQPCVCRGPACHRVGGRVVRGKLCVHGQGMRSKRTGKYFPSLAVLLPPGRKSWAALCDVLPTDSLGLNYESKTSE